MCSHPSISSKEEEALASRSRWSDPGIHVDETWRVTATTKELPDHLIRPQLDAYSTTSPKSRSISSAALGAKAKNMSAKEKKELKDQMKRKDNEKKKLHKADKNMKLIFVDVKRFLEKSFNEDESSKTS